MKKSKMTTVALVLSGSLLLSSCIGSFGLFNRVKDWNMGLSDSKFVNELVFLAFHIVPVYEICYLADIVVINSIEFWTGSNPIASVGDIETVKGENGNYTVETLENGYTITKEGEATALNLIFDKETQTWNAEANGTVAPLVKVNNDGTATMFMPDGSTQNVTLNAQGVVAANQMVMSNSFALR